MDRRECLHLLTGLAGGALLTREALGQEQPKEQLKPIPTIDPPDPNPKTPAFKLPPKSCDTHTHIFGPASRYPFASNRPYNTADAPLEAFRALHEKIGVERCVIVNATVHGTDNRVVTDAIAHWQANTPFRFPQRTAGFQPASRRGQRSLIVRLWSGTWVGNPSATEHVISQL